MKMKYTLAALAALTVSANAAIVLTTPVGGSTGNGGYSFQTLSLNDAGFTSTGDALTGTFDLDSISFTKGNNDTGSTTTFVSVYDGATFLGSSTNSFDWTDDGSIANGALALFDFTGVTGVDGLSDATQYEFRLVGATGAGVTGVSTRLEVRNGNPLTTGNLSADADWDAKLVINATEVSAVPEPSSTALLGLGGLALILRRRK